MELPSPDAVRAELAELDPRQRKIVAGLVSFLMRHPERVRDREWLLGTLSQVALLSGSPGADPEGSSDELGELQDYLKEHLPRLLAASLLLFQRVGVDLEPRAAEGFTFEEALAVTLGYLVPPDSAST